MFSSHHYLGIFYIQKDTNSSEIIFYNPQAIKKKEVILLVPAENIPPIVQIWISCSFIGDTKGMEWNDWSRVGSCAQRWVRVLSQSLGRVFLGQTKSQSSNLSWVNYALHPMVLRLTDQIEGLDLDALPLPRIEQPNNICPGPASF